jgi:hypothetical protein
MIKYKGAHKALFYFGLYFEASRISWISTFFIRSLRLSEGFFIMYDSTILNPIQPAALPGIENKNLKGASDQLPDRKLIGVKTRLFRQDINHIRDSLFSRLHLTGVNPK